MNDLLDKLGIRLPIVQAPMAGVSTPEMAAAVSNSGGLGSISVGAVEAVAAREMIRATQALTTRSFNVNVFCHQPAVADTERETAWLSYLRPHFAKFGVEPPTELREIYKSFLDDGDMLDLFLELRPKVVSFHFGLPPQEKIARLKEAGIVLLASATNVAEAVAIAAADIDAVVAQGYEAGGHRGVFNPANSDDCLGVKTLVREILIDIDIPVIAAGGIMDGAGIMSVLNLGAQAAQLGTAFIDCTESAADNYYRQALHSEAAKQTVLTKAISGRPARCLANLFTAIGDEVDALAIPDYPIAYDAGKALNAAGKARGQGGYGAHWAGQGAPSARSMPAAQLVAQLELEMSLVK
jgi:nitronate monooxygenase